VLTRVRDGEDGKRASLVCELPIAKQGHVNCSFEEEFRSSGSRTELHSVALEDLQGERLQTVKL
jgi:hypothetical protein